MTENEARQVIECIKEKLNDNSLIFYTKVEQKALDMAIQALEEIQQCRTIGTIEEFKGLKEKNVAKKPRFYAYNYYCTECGNLIGNNEFEWQRFLYVTNADRNLIGNKGWCEMNKCICDFCKEKEADRRYKVRRTYLTFPFTKNEKVDICDNCYINLFVKKAGAK